MAGVTWTEKQVSSTTYQQGIPMLPFSGFALFGMPIPVFETTVWGDSTASYTERTVALSSYTEQTVSSVTWTEKAL